MKVHIRFYAIFLILLLSCLAVAPAQGRDPWKAKPTCIFGMPYIGHAVMKDEKGVVTAILKAVYEPENIVLKHEPLPYKRAVQELRQGKIQCTLDLKNHRKGVLQAKSTLVFYDLAVARLSSTPWKGIQSMKGKRVAYLHGFGLDEFINVSVIPRQVYDLSSAFHMLEWGHVDYALGDAKLLKRAIFDSKLPTQDFVMDTIKTYEVRPIFASTDLGRRYRAMFDRRMKEMIASGELVDLLQEQGLPEATIERILKAN